MDSEASLDVVVAGHICVDVTLELDSAHTDVSAIVCPGRLTHVGPARLSLGGAVANTGLALHRLGVKTALRGLIGDDWLGETLLANLRRQDPLLAEHMRMVAGRDSSYTIVISPPGIDRAFLHCPGANDLFRRRRLGLGIDSAGAMAPFWVSTVDARHFVRWWSCTGLAVQSHSTGRCVCVARHGDAGRERDLGKSGVARVALDGAAVCGPVRSDFR